jgi:hypothetical protein
MPVTEALQQLGRLGRRLGRGEAPAEARAPEASEPRELHASEVEFSAYAEDCRIFGFLQHAQERLSDALNAGETFVLKDVLLVALADGQVTERRELEVQRDELLAVRATGSRGNAERRIRGRASPITLKLGPYTVHGYVHGPPGGDAIAQMRRRKPMVPLTEVWIEYLAAGLAHRARVGSLIVNRDAIDWVAHSHDETVRMPDLPAEARMGPLAKDLTGYIRASEGTLG